MSRLKRWLWDTGFWFAESLETWSWSPRHFRLLFWQTASNRTHRTYREIIAVIVEQQDRYVKAAYQQGAKDGVLQYAEYLYEQEQDIPPERGYIH